MNEADGKAFEDTGFFSQYINTWSTNYYISNKKEFDRAQDVAKIAIGLTRKESPASTSLGKLELYIFSALFVRCISNFQGCIILLHRGMNTDARILVRSCLECTFMLAAAREKGTEFVTRLVRQHRDSRKKIGLEMEQVHKNKMAFTAEQAIEVRKIIEKYVAEGAETYSFYDIAQHGKLENWYLFYRELSNYAAHPSLDSLTSLYDEKTDAIVFGPSSNADDLADIIDLGCMFLISSCKSFNEHLGEDTELTVLLDAEFHKLKRWQKTRGEEGDFP